MIGKKIKELRLKNKLSLRKLCVLADMAVSNLTLIEQDKVNPSVATLEKLAIALNYNQSDFFKDDTIEVIKEPVVASNDKKDLHGFTVNLVEKLLAEGIIDNTEVIPQHIIDAIISALLLDSKNKKH